MIAYFWKKDIPSEVLFAKYATPPSAFITIKGMNVHYKDQGNKLDKLPLILLHGTGASLHTWDDCIKKLDSSKRIITLDLPAYGLTGPDPNRDYSISAYISFVEEFVSKLGLSKFILGGNSLGGMISWNYALKHPTKVVKLILIDSAGFKFESKSKPLAFRLARIPVLKNGLLYISPKFVAKKSVENVYFNKSLVTPVIIDRYFDLFLREGNRQAFIDRMTEIYNDVEPENLSKLHQKTLIIWGENDELIPLEYGHLFSQKIMEDTLIVIENCGHVPMEEKYEETAIAINNFLKL